MPRRARLRAAHIPWHVYDRGNNRGPCFVDDEDRDRYLGLVAEAANANNCAVHAYTLMGNHVHFVLTPGDEFGPSRMMKLVNERYVPYFNKRHERTGSLWEGRFKSHLVESESYLLTLQHYVEANPVRASMVEHARDYEWSSYRTNAHGRLSLIVKPHPLFVSLGRDDLERQRMYRAWFEGGITEQELDLIRNSLRGGFVLGRPSFVERMEAALGKTVRRGEDGRPSKRERPEETDW